MKKLILLMAAVFMMSVAFMGCDNSSSSSDSKKGKFKIEAQIGEYDPITELNSSTKETEFLLVTLNDDKTSIKKLEVEIYFGGEKKGEVDFTENNPIPGYGMDIQLNIPGDDINTISEYFIAEGTYTLKIKAEDTKGNDSNTVKLTIEYSYFAG